MDILKRRKIFHVIRGENGEEEIKAVNEELIADEDGFEVTQIISSRRCSCGREVDGTEKTYICRTCSKRLCSICAFQCQAGCITCLSCAGIFERKVYCQNCWIELKVERLFRRRR